MRDDMMTSAPAAVGLPIGAAAGTGVNGHVPAADPFAPLSGAEAVRGHAAEPAEAAEAWSPATPAPAEPPEAAKVRHPAHGTAARRWVYRDAAGAPLFAVLRFDRPDGGKEVMPYSYGRRVWTDRQGKRRDRTGWHFKAPAEPRPLYGLDRLAARPDAPVLLVEGEKAADAAAVLFPDMVPITSQGGSKAAAKAGWSALHGRPVTIWPDHDEAGAAYARDAAALVTAAGAASVRSIQVPAAWPAGWDVADALPEGVTVATLADMVREAPRGEAVKLPDGFRFTARGLFFDRQATERDPNPPPVFVAAPFAVVGETRSDAGEAWGVLFRWQDRDGHPHQWAIPRRLVHDQGNSIAAELEDAGLECGSDGTAHNLLKRFVGGVQIERKLRCVGRTGWHMAEGKPVFVLPGGEAFGQGAADVILQSEHASADAAFRASGTLAEWRDGIAACAVGNDRLALFIAAAFAGPLLDVMAEPSGGLHLVGTSQSGKSTLALAAASVWGRGTSDAQVRQWRGTANGLEAVAAETSDALLILDELGQADAREVGDVVYMLANQSGKQRAGRSGTTRRRQTWRTLFLSTGEVTLAAKMGEVGRRAMAGLDVRLVNLPADAGAGLGVFQTLHGRANAAALADHLRLASRTSYGTAARAFLGRLGQDRCSDADALREVLAGLRNGFLNRHVPAGAASQVRSVAARFALAGVAGELARDYGVLPWPEGEAMRAAGACFAAWLAARGGIGTAEDAAALAQVRAFIEAHAESRFTLLVRNSDGMEAAPDAARTVNRVGFRRRVDDGTGQGERWEFLVLPEAWKAEVCKGIDAQRTADALIARGLLGGASARHRAALMTIPGEGKRRLYRVSGAILGDEPVEREDGTR
jgi:uncharacterized protein (DUF927 family)